MPITAIIGAQYGSEGKGKIAAYLSSEFGHAVRTGGPNAGHTVINETSTIVFRHLPCASINRSLRSYLGAGAIIDVKVLEDEIGRASVNPEMLMIDKQAVIIEAKDPISEATIQHSIGSTGKGVGAALLRKISRDGSARLVREVPVLRNFVGDVSSAICSALDCGDNVLLEGTQGTGLSLHHGIYPFVTSRDVTAGSLCGEAGLPPTAIDAVILVVRPYPIRVAGNSGPLYNEITWEEVQKRSNSPNDLTEYTTVTGLVRRVGEFDLDQVLTAVRQNGATDIALTFADHLNAIAFGTKSMSQLPAEVVKFVKMLEDATNVPVSLISTGPETTQIIDRRHRR